MGTSYRRAAKCHHRFLSADVEYLDADVYRLYRELERKWTKQRNTGAFSVRAMPRRCERGVHTSDDCTREQIPSADTFQNSRRKPVAPPSCSQVEFLPAPPPK